jgi:hypothetical protein
MINIAGLSLRVSQVAGRTGLVLSKYSPEILMGLGVVGAVVSTVLACKATLKINNVLVKSNADIDRIKYAHDNVIDPQVYSSEREYMTDLTAAHVEKVINIGKLYALPVAVGVVSIGCLIGSHGIMNQRSAALLGAYTVVEQAFDAYRKRVVEAIGPEQEGLIKMGLKEETVTETVVDENGKKTKVKKTVQKVSDIKPEDYNRVFAKHITPYFNDSVVLNEAFLKSQENYFNDKLIIKGHVYLNEVYEALGYEHTDYGAVVGWVNSDKRGKGEQGDNFVSFGMSSPNFYLKGDGMGVNGWNKDHQAFYLDFNVDGTIFGKIG